MNIPKTEKWGVTATLIPLVGGHRNAAFRTSGLQQNLVFKSTRRSPAAIAWLLDVQEKARHAAFEVPQRLESLNGQLVEDGWTCEFYVDGTHLEEDALPEILPQILAFHEATADLEQRPGFQSSKALLDASSGGDVDLGAMPPEIASRCREAWQAVSDRREAVIHGDLNSGNVLRTDDGRIALLDWDESRRDKVLFDRGLLEVDDPAGTQARLAWEVACSWLIEPEHAHQVAARL